MSAASQGPIFVVRLQSPLGADARRLRWFLKMTLRRLGLRCLSIAIEAPRPTVPDEAAS
jgi:hypothetical protein